MIYYPTPDKAERTALQVGDVISVTLKGDVSVLRDKNPLKLVEDEESCAGYSFLSTLPAKTKITHDFALFLARQVASIANLDVSDDIQFTDEGYFAFNVIQR